VQEQLQHPTTLAFELIAGVPDVLADPYPNYRALREQAPVHRIELPTGDVLWVLTRYEDCKAVLAHHEFGKAELDDRLQRSTGLLGQELPDLGEFDQVRPMLALNPPDHTRIRGLVSRAFTPRRVETLRARIDGLVADALDAMGDGEVELLDALAFPLPVAVIGELVGVPSEDWPRFRSLVRRAASALELNADASVVIEARDAMSEMRGYFDDLIAVRRADPRDDLLSALIAVEEAGERISHEELISNVILLFAAGFETTTNLIGNGVVALCRHPEELARLRADRALLPSAIEEILRYDSPVQVDGRNALVDTTLPDGSHVAAGEFAVTFLGAANRDPARFDDPERFDVARADNAPLSFAWGIHHCLGAGLARVEGQCVFGGLLDRYAGIELLDDPPRWRRSLILRGLDSLRVHLD
jgi:cytochrome P450